MLRETANTFNLKSPLWPPRSTKAPRWRLSRHRSRTIDQILPQKETSIATAWWKSSRTSWDMCSMLRLLWIKVSTKQLSHKGGNISCLYIAAKKNRLSGWNCFCLGFRKPLQMHSSISWPGENIKGKSLWYGPQITEHGPLFLRGGIYVHFYTKSIRIIQNPHLEDGGCQELAIPLKSCGINDQHHGVWPLTKFAAALKNIEIPRRGWVVNGGTYNKLQVDDAKYCTYISWC